MFSNDCWSKKFYGSSKGLAMLFTKSVLILTCMSMFQSAALLGQESTRKQANHMGGLNNTHSLIDLNRRLHKVKKLDLANLPTPFMYLANLSRHLQGPKIYLKSDNLSGHGGGGNKLRKLSYVLAEALQKNATDIITTGATQSNHCRMSASMCAKLGLKCHLILENRRSNYNSTHLNSGNVFLDHLFGANVHHVKQGTDTVKTMQALASDLKQAGRTPYIIPGGASNALGALGYVEAASELTQQMNQENIQATHIITATGSAGTQAGLAVGLQTIGSRAKLIGVSTRLDKMQQVQKVYTLAQNILKRLELPTHTLSNKDILVSDHFIGRGYGEPGSDCIEAIKMMAHQEGILLDPVYSGKAFAGLLSMVKNRELTQNDVVIFIHTGGEDSLPAYEDYFQFNHQANKS